MRQDLRWKTGLIFILVIIFSLLLGPLGKNLFKTDPIRLGLDLKGGIELLLAPDYRIGATQLNKLGNELSAKLTAANIPAPKVEYLGVMENNLYDGLKLTFASAADIQRARNVGALPTRYNLESFGETKHLNLTTKVSGSTVELGVLQNASDFSSDAVTNAKTIIEHRISEAAAGMAEAEVRLDQNGRLNVQLPGINTLEQARDLITATGRLTFRVNNQIVLDGSDLQDVNVTYDANEGGYVILFKFKGAGARQLAKVTTENVGNNMAVYLDETELMNPQIKDAITEGSGRITMGGRPKEEVERDGLLMKSGALPISLRVVQSNQVAPTLGKEIVRMATIGAVIGVAFVILFMLFFYGLPGMLADTALIMYAIFNLGLLAVFRGVLTLPGVAGFVLSLGMAVDANVIIFERIKDELRNGKRVRAAVEAGFDRAYVAIIDSNVTTVIAAGVLYFFGTTATQGFAVTLTLGVLVSMFTAIFVTKALIEWWIDRDPDRHAKQFGFKEVAE